MNGIPAVITRALLAWGLLAMLAACKPASEIRPDAAPAGAAAGAVSGSAPTRASLPPEACTREGAWPFFEEFVRRPEIRKAYSRIDLKTGASPGGDNFRIALVDNRWVYVDLNLPEGAFPRVRLTSSRDDGVFRVEYVVAQFGPDDEVLKRVGPAGGYVFEFRDGCWALTRAEP